MANYGWNQQQSAAYCDSLGGFLGKPTSPLPYSAMNPEGFGVDKIKTDIWSSWHGRNFKLEEFMFQNMHNAIISILYMYSLMSYEQAIQEFNLSVRGNQVTFDEWNFGSSVMGDVGLRHEGDLIGDERRRRTRTFRMNGGKFEFPMHVFDRVGDNQPTGRYYLNAKLVQIREGIVETWCYRTLVQTVVEAMHGANEILDKKFPLTIEEFESAVNENCAATLSLSKNGQAWSNIEAKAAESPEKYDTVIVNHGTIEHQFLVNSYNTLHSASGLLDQDMKEQLLHRGSATKLNNYKVVTSRRFVIDKRSDKQENPLVNEIVRGQRFVMIPENDDIAEGYTTDLRTVEIPNGMIGKWEKITAKIALDNCGAFSRSGSRGMTQLGVQLFSVLTDTPSPAGGGSGSSGAGGSFGGGSGGGNSSRPQSRRHGGGRRKQRRRRGDRGSYRAAASDSSSRASDGNENDPGKNFCLKKLYAQAGILDDVCMLVARTMDQNTITDLGGALDKCNSGGDAGNRSGGSGQERERKHDSPEDEFSRKKRETEMLFHRVMRGQSLPRTRGIPFITFISFEQQRGMMPSNSGRSFAADIYARDDAVRYYVNLAISAMRDIAEGNPVDFDQLKRLETAVDQSATGESAELSSGRSDFGLGQDDGSDEETSAAAYLVAVAIDIPTDEAKRKLEDVDDPVVSKALGIVATSLAKVPSQDQQETIKRFLKMAVNNTFDDQQRSAAGEVLSSIAQSKDDSPSQLATRAAAQVIAFMSQQGLGAKSNRGRRSGGSRNGGDQKSVQEKRADVESMFETAAITYKNLCALLTHNIIFPMSFLLFRRSLRIQVSPVIFMRSGPSTGFVVIKDAMVSVKRQVTTTTIEFGVKFSTGVFIRDHKGLMFYGNVKGIKLLGGAGISAHDYEEPSNLANPADIMYVAVEYGWKNTRTFTDSKGSVHPRYVSPNGQADPTHFSTYKVYRDHMAERHEDVHPLLFTSTPASRVQTFCVQAHQKCHGRNGEIHTIPGMDIMGPNAQPQDYKLINSALTAFGGTGIDMGGGYGRPYPRLR